MFQKVPLFNPSTINWYTAGGHDKVNRHLREDYNAAILSENVIRLAEELDRLPTFAGLVFRWAFSSEITDWAVGAEVEYRQFLSTTHGNPYTLDLFAFRPVLITIISKSGRNISHLSQYPDEKEVLFVFGSKFVVRFIGKREEKTIVLLEEIA